MTYVCFRRLKTPLALALALVACLCGATAADRGDFDGNHVPDLVWMNTSTRQVTVNYFGGAGGATLINWNWLNYAGAPGWYVAAAADFDGNGVPDLVWVNDSTGEVHINYYGGSGGTTLISWAVLYGAGSTAGWQIVGTGDFDGNGVPDVVWQNRFTGEVHVNYFGGTGGATLLGSSTLYAAGSATGWHVVAVADFNGDGVADIVWMNDDTRNVTVNYFGGFQGATLIGWNWLNAGGEPGWHVAGANDFNGDGVPDLVWQNDNTGQVTVNYYGGAGGATFLGWNQLYGAGSTTGWQLVVPRLGTPSPISDNSIVVTSTNPVSNSVNDPTAVSSYRWEPSSAYAGFWLSSWHDIGTVRGIPNQNVVHAFTSVWAGNGWSTGVEHRTPGTNLALMDTYTLWDPYRSRFVLAAVDFLPTASSIWMRYAADPAATSWEPMVVAMAGNPNPPLVKWDFPSIAVNPNSGRIVVGASQTTDADNTGYWTSHSDDGINWSPPALVNGPPPGQGGGTSRIVWSASGFHAFIQQVGGTCQSTPGAQVTLQHWLSQDGQTWTLQPDIDRTWRTYCVPLLSSNTTTNFGTVTVDPAGEVGYAATPDAVSSPGLGYVVAYPVNEAGYNAIVVDTELAEAVEISWNSNGSSRSYDLFNHGITTSTAGDWYLTYQMFGTPVGGSARIQENAAYRAPTGATKQSIIQTGIDPSQWWYYNSDRSRCVDPTACYTAGDWFRPSMNTYTVGSIPLMLGSPNVDDLFQLFVQDPPQTSSAPQSLPTIIKLARGSNLLARGVITPAHRQHVALGHYRHMLSSMAYAVASAAGLLPKP